MVGCELHHWEAYEQHIGNWADLCHEKYIKWFAEDVLFDVI